MHLQLKAPAVSIQLHTAAQQQPVPADGNLSLDTAASISAIDQILEASACRPCCFSAYPLAYTVRSPEANTRLKLVLSHIFPA